MKLESVGFITAENYLFGWRDTRMLWFRSVYNLTNLVWERISESDVYRPSKVNYRTERIKYL